MTITVTSTAFVHGEAIPTRFTGDGEDISPPLMWKGTPEGTKQFALICDDPDAPTAQPWVHWVIYRIPADVRSLPEGVPTSPQLTKPVTAVQGKNSWSSGVGIGYRGPLPPPGHGTHHYHFRLYALDSELDLKTGLSKQELLYAMADHILAKGDLLGTYQR